MGVGGIALVKVPNSKGDAVKIVLTGTLECRFLSSSLLVRGRRGEGLSRVVRRSKPRGFGRVRGRIGTSVRIASAIVTPNKDIVCYSRTVRRLGSVNGIVCLGLSLRSLSGELKGLGNHKILLGTNRDLGSLCRRHMPLCRGCTSVAVSRRKGSLSRDLQTVLRVVRVGRRKG